jgi:hypothetical protein
MSKVADVKLGWTKSVSSDVDHQEIILTIDGTTTEISVGPEVESYTLEVSAKSAVQFSIKSFDTEGLEVVSEVHTFTLGDLEVPQPATGLFHEIVGVRDVDLS